MTGVQTCALPIYTTKRSEVYNNLYRKMQKKDRLAAGYTLEKYERIYRQAFCGTNCYIPRNVLLYLHCGPVSYTHLDIDYSYEIQKKAAQQNQNVDTGKSALNITDKANNYVKAYADLDVIFEILFISSPIIPRAC